VEVRVKQPLSGETKWSDGAEFILIAQAKPFSRWQDMNRDQFLSAI
jgi:hypothetical protein